MSIQKAKNSSNNFNNLDPYHPNDPNYVYSPEEKIVHPEATFSYTKVYPTTAGLPDPTTASGSIVFVVDNPDGGSELYSDGTSWLPLNQ